MKVPTSVEFMPNLHRMQEKLENIIAYSKLTSAIILKISSCFSFHKRSFILRLLLHKTFRRGLPYTRMCVVG